MSHAGEIPSSQPTQEQLKALEESEAQWRALALQFDNHRMVALSHLKALLQDAEAHAPVARKFLSLPPLSGEDVLAQRIASIAAAPAATQPEGQNAWPTIETAPRDGTWIMIMREGRDEAYVAKWAEYPGNPVAGNDDAKDVWMWGWVLRDRLAYPGGMEDGFLGWEDDADHMPTNWTRLPGSSPAVQAEGGKA